MIFFLLPFSFAFSGRKKNSPSSSSSSLSVSLFPSDSHTHTQKQPDIRPRQGLHPRRIPKPRPRQAGRLLLALPLPARLHGVQAREGAHLLPLQPALQPGHVHADVLALRGLVPPAVRGAQQGRCGCGDRVEGFRVPAVRGDRGGSLGFLSEGCEENQEKKKRKTTKNNKNFEGGRGTQKNRTIRTSSLF